MHKYISLQTLWIFSSNAYFNLKEKIWSFFDSEFIILRRTTFNKYPTVLIEIRHRVTEKPILNF